ncbi:hypothetical protein N0V84_007896 [Fusarium piperis]|uniref:Uncharacterized protein n=1 Tax=Fusarium piperis TaxID=1435070 RepID=A0A9W8W9C7_9HYPO|nr:hypothetical protein N0V84_007896 [Fusarium piperis]
MRTTFFLTVFFLITRTWAGGFQGALEKVLIYAAYEIDGLNDPSSRKIGFKCAKWEKGECKDDKWVECKPKPATGRTRCNFNELNAHMGKADPKWKAVGDEDQNTRTPDIRKTAVNVDKLFNTPPRDGIPNTPPFKAMKGAGNNYNEFIVEVGEVVALASKHKDAGNQHLFDQFQSCLDQIKVARTGDHGAYLIEATERDLGKKHGMEIKTMDLGVNPISDPPERWLTVDWMATSVAARKAGITNSDQLITDFRKKWYDENEVAAKHRAVITSYKRVDNMMGKWCR